MHEVLIGPTGLMECDKCHAMWIDTATFEHISADRETQSAVLGQYGAPPSTPTTGAEVRYRRCVACGTMMNRINFGRVSGTVIDACKGHGVFLDAGELHQIVLFLQAGGLDRARQQQIDELKEEQDRLRSLQTQQQIFDGRVFGAATDVPVDSGWTVMALQHLLAQIKK